MANEILKNELTTLTDFKVHYEPSTITIENEDKLAEFVEKTVAHYDSLVFTEDNIAEAKRSRGELMKLLTALEDGRKDVKRNYSEPLNQFENRIKKYTMQVKKASDKIKILLDEHEASERESRQVIIEKTIQSMTEGTEVDPSEIEIKSTWLNKTSFSASGIVVKKVSEEISGMIALKVKELARIEADGVAISSLAKVYGLEPESWIQLVQGGQTAAELIPLMEKAVADKKARLEEEEKKRKAKEEYETAMRQLELEKQSTAGDKIIDSETGEVIEDLSNKTPELQTAVLEIKGTMEQFQALNHYMVTNGILVRSLD